jgi:hypothetical protein
MPISEAVQSNAWVCGRSLAGIVGLGSAAARLLGLWVWGLQPLACWDCGFGVCGRSLAGIVGLGSAAARLLGLWV